MRETRSTEEQVQRRKRDNGEMTAQRMPVARSMLDMDRFAYRWVNDTPGRLKFFYDDNWDVVMQDGSGMAPNATDLGAAVAQVVGVSADGKALSAYLMRKPRTFYDEDQKQKNADLDDQLAQMRRGNDRSGGAQADYIPREGIRL